MAENKSFEELDKDNLHMIIETTDAYRFGGKQQLSISRKVGTIRWYVDSDDTSGVIDLDKLVFPFEIEYVYYNDINQTTGEIEMKKVEYENFHTDLITKFDEKLEAWRKSHKS